MAKKIVSWDDYCQMTEQEQRAVHVVCFTGLTDLTELTSGGTLGVEPSEGGRDVPQPPKASE